MFVWFVLTVCILFNRQDFNFLYYEHKLFYNKLSSGIFNQPCKKKCPVMILESNLCCSYCQKIIIVNLFHDLNNLWSCLLYFMCHFVILYSFVNIFKSLNFYIMCHSASIFMISVLVGGVFSLFLSLTITQYINLQYRNAKRINEGHVHTKYELLISISFCNNHKLS